MNYIEVFRRKVFIEKEFLQQISKLSESARMPIGQHSKLPCVCLTDPITIKLNFLLGRKRKKKKKMLIFLLSDTELPNDTNLIFPAVLLSAFPNALFVIERL